MGEFLNQLTGAQGADSQNMGYYNPASPQMAQGAMPSSSQFGGANTTPLGMGQGAGGASMAPTGQSSILSILANSRAGR